MTTLELIAVGVGAVLGWGNGMLSAWLHALRRPRPSGRQPASTSAFRGGLPDAGHGLRPEASPGARS
jgi:hypothetical protein